MRPAAPAPALQRRRAGWLALGLILLATGLLWRNQRVQPLNAFDQPFYLGIANDLLHQRRFTDGYMFAGPGPRPPGMRFAPLYPMLVAGAAAVDGGLRQGIDCLVASAGHDAGCPRAAPSLRGLQFIELAGFLWLVWWMAAAIGGMQTAWLAVALAGGAAPLLLRSVNYLMTEMTSLTLATAAMAAGLRCLSATFRPALRWAAAAAALLALAALTRPAYLYLIPATVLAGAALAGRRGWPPLAAFGVAAGLTLAPWLLRNEVVMGRAALTYGYDSHTLVQRIAFDTMDWREYGRAYLCWLPDGTGLGAYLLGAHACDRFGWDDQPSSFYVLGLRHMLPETLQAAGGYEHHLGYLMNHYILAMPMWHALVSMPLALRGAYVAHWWGFILLWPALACSWVARPWARRESDAFWQPGFLLLAWPAWFMLAFNAAVAVNQVRYNLLLIPAYAVSGALGLVWLGQRMGRCA